MWLDETNADYFCPKVDEKWTGAIPATLFINNSKNYRKFMEEQLSEEELEKEILALLGKKRLSWFVLFRLGNHFFVVIYLGATKAQRAEITIVKD